MGKRKLNADLVPEEHAQSPSANDASNIEAASPSKAATTAAAAATAAQKTAPPSSWEDIAIEPRLKRAVKTLQWSSPTLVQASAIPHILEGRDLLIRSGTGSGKSAAFMLPLLTKTLQQKRQTLILAPTKELASQLTKVAKSLTAYATEIRVRNIAGQESDAVTKAALADRPEIVVATPARAWANIAALTSASAVVVDEADLTIAYGSQSDLQSISENLPSGVQKILVSATLNTEVESLGALLCTDPVILKLDDAKEKSSRIKQYVLKVAEEEKFLLIYAMFKLQLIKGKTIIFVGDVDRSYRVKLFLEQFGIKAVVLNHELPLQSRTHIVEEFNKNIYNILIASDDSEVVGQESESRPKKKAKKTKENTDSGVSRGIDFLNVACVLQFDFALSYKSYFHRIGRTARAGKSGTAISFIIPKEKFRKHKPTSFPGAEHDEEILQKVEKHQLEGQTLENYQLDMAKLEAFRYRFTDALRSVTRIAIREARLKELRLELSKSEKLSRYFEENPETLQQLRHDQTLNHPARIQQHLKNVPDYLLPGGSRKPADVGFAGLNLPRPDRKKYVKGKGRKVVRGKNGKVDPLKTFNARGKGKK